MELVSEVLDKQLFLEEHLSLKGIDVKKTVHYAWGFSVEMLKFSQI